MKRLGILNLYKGFPNVLRLSASKNILMFCAVWLVPFFCGFQKAESHTNVYTKTQIEAFIREVFADHADELVLQSNTSRLQLIQDFLSRVEVLDKPEYAGKNYRLLSTVALLSKYNPGLKRDASYNPATFNPLKYNFPMASKAKEIYRFDHSNYVIIIQPIP